MPVRASGDGPGLLAFARTLARACPDDVSCALLDDKCRPGVLVRAQNGRERQRDLEPESRTGEVPAVGSSRRYESWHDLVAAGRMHGSAGWDVLVDALTPAQPSGLV
ncbi:hypothetical protein [uncultured Methylobacterium sp.]|uniref:hypothetical protein n=1 Tax=uncultured Methylobacterium sp. TaxID=157278 RepID=UPI00261E7C55|nr:hypothetical protein [uncultured Methylobacterium sp.]